MLRNLRTSCTFPGAGKPWTASVMQGLDLRLFVVMMCSRYSTFFLRNIHFAGFSVRLADFNQSMTLRRWLRWSWRVSEKTRMSSR